MIDFALDTSVAVPLLMARHPSHHAVIDLVGQRRIAMTAQSLAETYSVLTRLPGDARLDPRDAAELTTTGFDAPLCLEPHEFESLPGILAAAGVAGVAVYDALVGLAAKGAEVPLLSRDSRAIPTYRRLAVDVRVVSG